MLNLNNSTLYFCFCNPHNCFYRIEVFVTVQFEKVKQLKGTRDDIINNDIEHTRLTHLNKEKLISDN